MTSNDSTTILEVAQKMAKREGMEWEKLSELLKDAFIHNAKILANPPEPTPATHDIVPNLTVKEKKELADFEDKERQASEAARQAMVAGEEKDKFEAEGEEEDALPLEDTKAPVDDGIGLPPDLPPEIPKAPEVPVIKKKRKSPKK